MSDLQANKKLILKYYEDLDAADADAVGTAIAAHTTNDYFWRGMHPFYEQTSAFDVAEVFWKPFRRSFTSLQRRPDVLMAGLNDADGGKSEWVCSMGHLMGLFDEPWLGIPPTQKLAFLRYAEFHRIAEGKIAESALFCDVIGVMQQAGHDPFPNQTGAAVVTPGPSTHDGLLLEQQDPVESRQTLALINQLIADLTTSYTHAQERDLAQCWHGDMVWFGPAGIGATFTRDRYCEQHQNPFREGLTDIAFNGHVCRFAEGRYGGFFGWANLSMKSAGGFMGLPASDKLTEMRVVDVYRREGDKLAENWIFIDLLHFLSLLGVDLLAEIPRRSGS